jgi:hypothetical protein
LQYGAAASDLVREESAAGKPANELQFLPINALQGISIVDVVKLRVSADPQ